MKEDIQRIINDSITAPSPDNFQPWRFTVDGNVINVYKVFEKVNHLLDYNEHVLILTNGMLLENISIAASHHRYSAQISRFPDPSSPDLVATITLQKNPDVKGDPLYGFLKRRCTNRKKYKKARIEPGVLYELAETRKGFPAIEMQYVTEQDQIKKLGKAVSAVDKIMCEHKDLHQALFHHITWTKEEEQQTHQGLSLDSMELNAMDKSMFKLISKWSVINALNKIGFSNIIRAKNASQYGSAPCSVIVSTRNDSPADYLDAGRFVQRFWLTATQKGLSLHPIVGVIYCNQKAAYEQPKIFSTAHADLLSQSYQVIDSIAAAKGKTNKHIVFFFRMGYADPTSYQSTRKEAEIVFNK
jgi:hypothetical protein